MSARLSLLALRRQLPPAIAVVLAVAAVLLARASWAPPEELIAGADAGATMRALTRQGVWTGMLVLAVPLLVARAAGTIAGWRKGEIDWIASAPASKVGVLLSTWAGGAAAAAIALAGIALAAELAAGASPPGYRWQRRVDLELASPRAPGARLAADLGELDPPPQSRLVARVALVAGAPASDVRFAVSRASSGEVRKTEVTRRISGRAALAVEVPQGSGPLSIELETLDSDALVVLEDAGLGLLTPVATERCASLALALRAWVATAAWLALALGAGAWMSTATATGLAFALALPAWLGETRAGWAAWPWVGLADALELVGEELVPPPIAWPALAGACAAVALGIALGAARMHLGRNET